MKLSIIVATYNRKHELKELFESLQHQTLPPDRFEIVVIDDGSTDGTGQYIGEIESTVSFGIQYHYHQNKGPGYARTLGMEQANGDVFIFIDSDCIAPPHYLQTIADVFQYRQIDAFGGPDKSSQAFSPWDKAVNYVMTSFLTTGGLRGSSGKMLARYYPRSFNMGLRREVFEKIGGFGSIYHYGEDIEFSRRIIESGARVEYIEDAFVYHKRRSSPVSFMKQVFKMGKARIQLGQIDRSMLEPLHFIPSFFLITLFVFVVGAIVSDIVRVLFVIVLLGFLIFCLYLTIDGYRQSRDPLTAILIPIVFCIQIAAYGTGMIAEGIQTLRKK